MKKLKLNSLRFRSVLLLLTMVVLMIGLVAYNNYSAYTLLLKKVYSNTEDTLALYQKHLDEVLERSETYLYTTSTNNGSLISLKYMDMNTTEWFNALYQLRNSLQNAVATYTMDEIFCYIPEKDTYVTGSGNASITGIDFKKRIKGAIEDETINLADWTVIKEAGAYYFMRVLHIGETYVGAWTGMETLLELLAQNGKTNGSLYFVTPDGQLLRNGVEPLRMTPPEEKKNPYERELIEEQKMLSVSKMLESAPLYLTSLVPESEFSNNGSDMVQVIIIVFFGLGLIWLIFVVVMKRWILTPVRALTDAIERLRSGDLKTYVPVSNQLDEFQNMTSAFNDMVSEIEDLKIHVYERKLQKQRLEAQYLKQQITPHFMINCLNTTYQLTETGHFDLARKMLKDLSRHLRFILSSGQTVSLQEELQLVENYIELSGIRYPYSIRYVCSCPDDLTRATVIPLMFLNFVENTIKYEVRMGQILEIHIEVEKTIRDGQEMVKVCIWDSGSGFSKDILNILQDLDGYLEKEGEHIGIANVIMRARHVYKQPYFSFCNRRSAGAQVDMVFPYIVFQGEKKDGKA
ncbi:MAG: sensor histidine kinase [Catenibacillus sp.]